jgi:hypothetical protein
MRVELISREVQSAPPQMQTDDARWSWDTFNNHYRDLLQIYNRTLNGFIYNTSNVTSSPYDISESDDEIFVDTDSSPVTVNLPIGVNGKRYRIINTGSSNNDVTIVPNGLELLTGINASRTLSDSSVVILTYNTTEGWW